ncbi:MAG: phage tail protein [Flavobacteriales bacterium]|nr:phage tail protein [Flavobacteriales bacterium]
MSNYYPPTGFRFRVEIIGMAEDTDQETGFQEVSGLSISVETEPFVEGGENRFTHRFPKPPTYSNLVLKRGIRIGSTMVQWFKTSVEGFKFEPKDVLITLLNEEGEPLEAWNVVNAIPVKWNIAGFNAQNNQVAIEDIELSFQYFQRMNLPKK